MRVKKTIPEEKNRRTRCQVAAIQTEPRAPVTEGGIGQVLDAPPPGEETPTIEEQAREWDVAVNQATTVARQAGKVPAGLHRTLDGAAEAAIDWREMLRRLWSETTPADYSWTRPNRRHIWAGLYLPGVIREGVGEIAIAVDCSGSVNGRQLRLFEAEVRSILEGQRPERVYVLYFDAAVQKVETYEAGQRVDLQPVGGGGTEFGPCFEWLDERGILPQTMVFLTDLYGSFPDSAPAYPVLWASTGSRQRSLWRSHPYAGRLAKCTGLLACMFRQHFQGRADSLACSGGESALAGTASRSIAASLANESVRAGI